ncbi:hypothetical protein [Microbacterium xanthum]|uniref:hypothetical protein n=1 Tax=Microbacterium xanthum TaxID=3079794 RepID=UPI002AD2937B|nr:MULTISPECIES: hypothetical protein [unclassified Microbacterium]MDZ8172961.1 hypothetical protein [Microbacterium sp. KSW-48]MDZ8200879.1 hypothetical protein [Microbacterium sp. SSW1-59]
MNESGPRRREHRRVIADRRQDGRVGVAMVGMAVVVWWPAFTLGAYDDLFFDQLMAVWAAATAAFVFVLVERRPVGVRLLRAFLLLLPSVWLALMFFINDEEEDIFVFLIDAGAILAVLIGLPFTLWLLVRIVWPEFGDETRVSTKWLIALVVVGVAAASYVLGVNHQAFLTCDDFTESGNSAPADCTPD